MSMTLILVSVMGVFKPGNMELCDSEERSCERH